MRNPRMQYEKRKNKYSELHKKYKKTTDLISNLRLLVFIGGAAGAVYLYLTGQKGPGALVLGASVLCFIFLVIRHGDIIYKRDYTALLLKVNETSLERLAGHWKAFNDEGEEFINNDHSYSHDLDVFGRGSLFQWINTTGTFRGRQKLKDILEKPIKTAGEIHRRQEAVGELSDMLDWRQKLQAEAAAYVSNQGLDDTEPLVRWAKKQDAFFHRPWAVGLSYLLPAITGILAVLAFIPGWIPYYLPVLSVVAQMAYLSLRIRGMSAVFSVTDKYRESIKAYEGMLKLIEEEGFSSDYLKELKLRLYNEKGEGAKRQIKGLTKVIDMISFRYSQFYIVFDILTLWDYHCMIALERWKKKSGAYLEDWLDVIGEFESLASLAVIHHDHPDWALPVINGGMTGFRAKKLGHPLLPENRVCNDLKAGGGENILLITGSNMSGKSTLLRTAGINLVLAYSGAPVCAQEFRCSLMNVYTSMRVSDNLEENISSFYAELLRIKKVVKASERGEKIFFLLDEIFKGTNSLDRHTGARILIKKLSRSGAIGIVSTHDLELGDLEKEDKGVGNYHFQEHYKNGEIHFDYILRRGVSTTRNAMYLMKMAGIDVSSE